MNACVWLWPFSVVYRFIISIRLLLYRIGVFKTCYFPVPTIIVGNITIGGTGKTPLVIYLARLFKQHGYRPGLVSRGYKGTASQYPIWVRHTSDPAIVGDEPLLLYRHTACPTVVDPKRTRAVATLLAETDCNVILSDDGLQHYALGRSLEIAVVDGQNRFGNQLYLPAGPLREPIRRLKTVDFIVVNGAAQLGEWAMQLNINTFYSLVHPHHQVLPTAFRGKKLHAVAGIGNPQRFFQALRQLGLDIITHPFPDHYAFQARDFDYGADAIILLTEKDAVKCTNFADERFWCTATTTQLAIGFDQQILARVLHLQRLSE